MVSNFSQSNFQSWFIVISRTRKQIKIYIRFHAKYPMMIFKFRWVAILRNIYKIVLLFHKFCLWESSSVCLSLYSSSFFYRILFLRNFYWWRTPWRNSVITSDEVSVIMARKLGVALVHHFPRDATLLIWIVFPTSKLFFRLFCNISSDFVCSTPFVNFIGRKVPAERHFVPGFLDSRTHSSQIPSRRSGTQDCLWHAQSLSMSSRGASGETPEDIFLYG